MVKSLTLKTHTYSINAIPLSTYQKKNGSIKIFGSSKVAKIFIIYYDNIFHNKYIRTKLPLKFASIKGDRTYRFIQSLLQARSSQLFLPSITLKQIYIRDFSSFLKAIEMKIFQFLFYFMSLCSKESVYLPNMYSHLRLVKLN